MQLSQDTRSLDLSKADLSKADSPKAQLKSSPACAPQGAAVQNWRYAGAFTGVAAVASAGIVLPLAGESAIAYSAPSEVAVSQQQAATVDRAATDKRASQSEPLAPQVTQTNRARFSESEQSGATGRTGRSAQGELAARTTASVSQTPLLARGNDGNWTIAYSAGASQQSQAVMAQLAQQSAQAAQARQNCTGGECQRLAYVDAQLPQAQQRLQAIQQSLVEFEALHGQQDMAAYQAVLTSRIAEITQQNTQLETSLEQTRRDITQLKMRLATVNADTDIAERILSQDDAYQATWVRLEQAEGNLLEEFSKVNLDATRLNEIYADYRYQQQQLQRASQEALGGYLTNPDTVAPSFVYQAPAALDIMQDLVISTHQYQVQQLRQNTIDKIEQSLQSRQQQLVESLGQYEQLQRELTIAQESVAQYQGERDGVSADSQIASQGQPAAAPSPAVAQAQTLASRLPEGSVAKTVLGVVVVAGAIASAAAWKRSKKATYRPEAARPDFRPTVDSAALSIFQAEAAKVEGFEVISFEANRIPAWVDAARPQRQSPTEALPTELLQTTEQSAQVIKAYAAAQTDTVEDDFTVEIMVRELDEILSQATAEAKFISGEINPQPLAPVQLPVKDIDLFAEHAVRWVLKDLGLEAPAKNAAPAKQVRAA